MARSSLFAPPARNYSPGDRAEMSRFATPKEAAERPTLRRPMVTGGGGFRGGGVVRQTRANTSGPDLRTLGLQRQRQLQQTAGATSALATPALRPTVDPGMDRRADAKKPWLRDMLRSKQFEVWNTLANREMDQERLGLQRQGMAFDQQATAARLAQDQRQFDAGLGLRREGMMYDRERDTLNRIDDRLDRREDRDSRMLDRTESREMQDERDMRDLPRYYTPESIQAYQQSGNAADLRPLPEAAKPEKPRPYTETKQIREDMETLQGIIADDNETPENKAAAEAQLRFIQENYPIGLTRGGGAPTPDPIAGADPNSLAPMPGEPGYTGLRRTPPAGGGMQSAVPRTREDLAAQIRARGLNPADFDLDAMLRATQGQ